MMARRGLASVTAVEPNDDMRREGAASADNGMVRWVAGSGETTNLPDKVADLVTAASSFHWMDYPKTSKEIQRMLRPGGRFMALWNPRKVEASPMLTEIEGYLAKLNPNMKRVSSGRSAFTDGLSDLLASTAGFDDLLYMEGRHIARQTPDEYLGAWRSVNDIQAQLGPDKWQEFMSLTERRLSGVSVVETVFLTRAWTVRYTG
jgi:SAM-dependent methyltransferase